MITTKSVGSPSFEIRTRLQEISATAKRDVVADISFRVGMAEKKDKNPHAVHLGQLGGKAQINVLRRFVSEKPLSRRPWT